MKSMEPYDTQPAEEPDERRDEMECSGCEDETINWVPVLLARIALDILDRKLTAGEVYSALAWSKHGMRPKDFPAALAEIEEAGFVEVLGENSFKVLEIPEAWRRFALGR